MKCKQFFNDMHDKQFTILICLIRQKRVTRVSTQTAETNGHVK